MGKENEAMLEFLRDNQRFADLFNGSLFAGEQVVKADELQDAGETYTEERERDYLTRTRDIKKRLSSGAEADRWSDLFLDYEMKLICVNELEEISLFTSELKELFALMRFRKDRHGMTTYLEKHEEYKNIDEDTARAISAVMGVKGFMKNGENFKNDRGGYDMCQAIREMWEDGIQIGLERGRNEGRVEGKAEGI